MKKLIALIVFFCSTAAWPQTKEQATITVNCDESNRRDIYLQFVALLKKLGPWVAKLEDEAVQKGQWEISIVQSPDSGHEYNLDIRISTSNGLRAPIFKLDFSGKTADQLVGEFKTETLRYLHLETPPEKKAADKAAAHPPPESIPGVQFFKNLF